MAETSLDRPPRLHAAYSVLVRTGDELRFTESLLDRGEQLVAVFPSSRDREEGDRLIEAFLSFVDESGALAALVHEASPVVGSPWRRRFALTRGARSFVVTPKERSEPTVRVFTAHDEDGNPRLVMTRTTDITARELAVFDIGRRRLSDEAAAEGLRLAGISCQLLGPDSIVWDEAMVRIDPYRLLVPKGDAERAVNILKDLHRK